MLLEIVTLGFSSGLEIVLLGFARVKGFFGHLVVVTSPQVFARVVDLDLRSVVM